MQLAVIHILSKIVIMDLGLVAPFGCQLFYMFSYDMLLLGCTHELVSACNNLIALNPHQVQAVSSLENEYLFELQ